MRFAATTRPATALLCALAAALAPAASRAAERVTLRNGFAIDCSRQEARGDRVKLYLLPQTPSPQAAAPANYMEVATGEIANVEPLADPAPLLGNALAPQSIAGASRASNGKLAATKNHSRAASLPELELSASEIAPMLADAQSAHNVDADLLWSVVHAESAGNPRAVSRAGAQGLMQLMPGTAAQLGVADTFAPAQNIGGGAAYLDQMLARYHDNLPLALAAYNAGPAAVDRYRGIPPYRETRAYVARVIHQFNARKRLLASK